MAPQGLLPTRRPGQEKLHRERRLAGAEALDQIQAPGREAAREQLVEPLDTSGDVWVVRFAACGHEAKV